jgi:hypothetical protein
VDCTIRASSLIWIDLETDGVHRGRLNVTTVDAVRVRLEREELQLAMCARSIGAS